MQKPVEGFERFSSKDFLLERGKATFRYLGQEWRNHILSFLIRSLLFIGFLGMIWVITHLHPNGELSLYLVPFILFAMPIAMIAPKEYTWQKTLNYVFISVYWVMLIWSTIWYFKDDYSFRWLLLSTILTMILSWIATFQPPNKRLGPQQYLLMVLWLIGISICLIFLGFLTYYLLESKTPEIDTTNLLAGGCFVFFTTMMLMRIFWLNSVRNRRATRSEHTPPQDFVLFFEWLIPNSYSFILVLISVLLAEAMLFSTINYAMLIKFQKEATRVEYQKQQQQQQQQQYQKLIKPKNRLYSEEYMTSQEDDKLLYKNQSYLNATSIHHTPSLLLEDSPKLDHFLPDLNSFHDQNNEKNQKHPKHQKHKKIEINDIHTLQPIVRLEIYEKWLFFSFKPYVFPKNANDQELKTPEWFKVLGRTLLGLIFAILLTQQFNIWQRLNGLYGTLLGAKKRIILRGFDEDLDRQGKETLLLILSTFNHLSSFWRYLIFMSVINLKLKLRWKLLFDPSLVFFDMIERMQNWLMSRWYMALSSVAFVITCITYPFYFFEQSADLQLMIFESMINAIQPICLCSAMIIVLRFAFHLSPPKSYQFWMWWLLLLHFIVSVLLFFLSISISSTETFWSKILWYLQLGSIWIFPALYLFGGERHRHLASFGVRKDVQLDDCDIHTNLEILRAIFETEHRQWLVRKIISYIHPIRTGSIQLKLILPSILLGLIDFLRFLLTKFSVLMRWLAKDYGKSALIWLVLVGGICLIAMLWHMFGYHKFLPDTILSIYIFNFFCLALPTGLTTAFLSIKKLGKSKEWQRPTRPLLLLTWLFLISCLSIYVWWYYFHARNDHLVSQEIYDQMVTYTRFTYVFIVPIIPIWVLYEQYRQAKTINQKITPMPIKVLDRFAHWLLTLEQYFFNTIYQKTMKDKDLESAIRIELIKGAHHLLKSTYQAIASGKWYEEEDHAIRRVYLQWIGEYQREDEQQQLGEELTDLQEQLVDALSSLMHDLMIGQLKIDQQESVLETTIYTLTEICHLPKPSELLKQCELKTRFCTCYEALTQMIKWMLFVLKNELVAQHRAELLKLLSALGGDSFEEVAQQLLSTLSEQKSDFENEEHFKQAIQTLKLELIDASMLQGNALALIESFKADLNNQTNVDSKIYNQQFMKEEYFQQRLALAELSKKLPTPLAITFFRFYEAFESFDQHQLHIDQHQHQFIIHRHVVSSKVYPLSLTTNLEGMQNPVPVKNRQLFLRTLADHPTVKQQLYQRFFNVFLESIAYLFSLIKDIEFLYTPQFKLYKQELQDLSCHTSNEVINSLQHLRRINLKDAKANEIKNLMLRLYPIAQIKQIEKIYLSQKDLKHGVAIIMQIFKEWIKYQSIFPIICYHPTRQSLNQIYQDINNTDINNTDINHTDINHTDINHTDINHTDINHTDINNHNFSFPKYQPVPTEPLESVLVLEGLKPRKIALESLKSQDRLLIPFGRGIWMKAFDVRPIIDYYPAIWCLKLIRSLSYSDGLFHPDRKEKIQDYLNQLLEISARFAVLLRPFPPEEQRVISEIYQAVAERLYSLKNSSLDALNSTEGQGNINFEATLLQLYKYIDGLEDRIKRKLDHLFVLEMLADESFVYLKGAEKQLLGELRWYEGFGDEQIHVILDKITF